MEVYCLAEAHSEGHSFVLSFLAHVQGEQTVPAPCSWAPNHQFQDI